jgi:hypothetical protein
MDMLHYKIFEHLFDLMNVDQQKNVLMMYLNLAFLYSMFQLEHNEEDVRNHLYYLVNLIYHIYKNQVKLNLKI